MAHVSKILRLSSTLVILSLMGGMAASAEVVDTSKLPSVVEGLAAVPGDGQVTLTWDAATDDTGVEGYYVYSGLQSVAEKGGSYTFPSIDAANTTSYTVDNLTNGVTYYFAVSAYDTDGNESEFYSKEVEATPESSEVADYTAPTVKSASAVTNSLVEVNFSEAVELPTDPSSAFALTATDGTPLEVISAYASDDAATVFLVTDLQEAGTEYELTAGISISDKAGNPIESGTSDTAYFTGSGLEKTEDAPVAPVEKTSDEFMVQDIDPTDVNELQVTFTQELVSADAHAFTIQQADDATKEIEVLAVSVDKNDAKKITLVTEEMDPGYDYILTMDDTLFNKEGAALSKDNRSVDFTSKTLDLADLVPPEMITHLLAKVSGDSSILLTWTASVDSAGDLAEYWLYQSIDGGKTFDDAVKLMKSKTEYTADKLTPGESYTFKVTAVDENGNESEGVLTTVELPKAGPEMLVLGFISLLGAGVNSRRKKKL